MSDADALGAAGECPRVTADGREWRVGWPTKRSKSRLMELVAAQAVREVLALKSALPPADYAPLWDGVQTALAAREHRTGGALWQRVMASQSGATLFLLALLRENHPEAAEDDAKRLAATEPEQVTAAVLRVTPPFFQLVGEELGLPPDQMTEAARQAVGRTTPTGPTS